MQHEQLGSSSKAANMQHALLSIISVRFQSPAEAGPCFGGYPIHFQTGLQFQSL